MTSRNKNKQWNKPNPSGQASFSGARRDTGISSVTNKPKPSVIDHPMFSSTPKSVKNAGMRLFEIHVPSFCFQNLIHTYKLEVPLGQA